MTYGLLFWASTAVFAADSEPTSGAGKCHFLAYYPGTSTLTDPVKRVADFIEGNWLEIENQIAYGEGDALSYLRKLAICPFELPEHFWRDKAIAYADVVDPE